MVKCKAQGCSAEFHPRPGAKFCCCPKCRVMNCLNCAAVHENMNCASYRNSLKQDLPKISGQLSEEEKLQTESSADQLSLVCAGKECKHPVSVKRTDKYFVCAKCRELNCVVCREAHFGKPCPRRNTVPDSSRDLQDTSRTDMNYIVEINCVFCEYINFVPKSTLNMKCEYCKKIICTECRVNHDDETHEDYLARIFKTSGASSGSSSEVESSTPRNMMCASGNCDRLSEISPSTLSFRCSKCNLVTCVSCRAVHDGKTCRQYSSTKPLPIKFQQDLALYQKDIVPNSEDCECSICYVAVNKNEGIKLKNCLHAFCRSCLQDYVKQTNALTVNCPYEFQDVKCSYALTDGEIRSLLSGKTYEELQKKAMLALEISDDDSFHCKTPGCPVWYLITPGVSNFCCPGCEAVNCVSCKAIHRGLSCRQYQTRQGNA